MIHSIDLEFSGPTNEEGDDLTSELRLRCEISSLPQVLRPLRKLR
jgi:hypothetical protein